MDTTRIVLERTERLCRIDSATGSVDGSLALIEELRAQIPAAASLRTMPSSSPDAGEDVLVTLPGTGTGGALLLGHYDTVPRAIGAPLWEPDGDRIRGLGTYDMKGGLAIALQLLAAWARTPERFSSLSLLVLSDEEWRVRPPRYRQSPWLGVGGVLCFEGGELGCARSVVDGRYGAAILRSEVRTSARRAELPLRGPSSIDGLAGLLVQQRVVAEHCMPAVQLVTSQVQAGEAINVVPACAQATSVVRFQDEHALHALMQMLPVRVAECEVTHALDVRFPPLVPTASGAALLAGARTRFPELAIVHRVGSSDCCWFAEAFEVVFDGLGPVGAGEHSSEEYILASSIAAQYALADDLLARVVARVPGRAHVLTSLL